MRLAIGETHPVTPERRRAPRSLSKVPLEIYDSKGQMVVGEGRFLNLSVTGAMMKSQRLIKPRLGPCFEQFSRARGEDASSVSSMLSTNADRGLSRS